MVVLHVEEVKKKPRELDFSEAASSFEALHEMELAGECVFLTPVTGKLLACWEYDHVRVSGEARTRVRISSARCTADFEQELQSSFVIYYSEAVPGEEVDDEIELAEQDLLSANYVGDEIRVMQEIAEQILTELPLKPLCDERCLGLCSSCGADLNREDCACERQNGTLAFSALKQFTVTRKGE